MPIPTPKGNETEQEFVSRCIEAIYDEYGKEQASAICYSTYRKSKSIVEKKRAFSNIVRIISKMVLKK